MNNILQLALHPTPTEATALQDTMLAFNSAKNIVLQEASRKDCFNKHKLSKELYYQIKNDFLLPSQLTICSITTVVEDHKKGETPSHYEDFDEVFYDKRVVSFRGLQTTSIATTIGRIQPKFTFEKYLSWKEAPTQIGSAILRYVDGKFHLFTIIA